MTMPITPTIGCDLGDRTTHFCVLDVDGEVEERGEFATTPAGFRRVFAKRKRIRVVIEVGAQSPWIAELLEQLGPEVFVANPRQVGWIGKSRHKTDRVDAKKLAQLGQFNPQLLAPIRHRGRRARAEIARIRARQALVRARTLLVNHVRGVVKSNGGRLNKCTTSAFAKSARGALPEGIREALEPVLDQVEQLSAKIKALKVEIEEKLPERYPEIERLRQVPGVGPITAAAFVLTIEDPNRFERNRHVASFLGLCPARRQSGRADPELHISKQGDRFLRSVLVECAQFILSSRGQDSDLRRWGLALASRGRKAAKKRAVIAVARKLAVLLCALWKSEKPYEALRPPAPKQVAA